MGDLVSIGGEPKKAAKANGRWAPWDGGRKWIDADGRVTYYIRRSVNGRRYEVRTSATTERAAFEQLKRFEADPEGYDPRGEERAEAVYLDEDLARAFLAWSVAPRKDGGAGNTPRWVGQQRLYLAAWADHLHGVDLRRATLRDHVLPALKGATCRPQRIAVLKRLYSWLRKVEHRIESSEDPTLDQLTVPAASPEQLRRVKAVPKEHLDLAIKHLESDRWRDLLRVLAGTGMHVSELERFAAGGAVEPLPRSGRAEGSAGVVVIPSTKDGDPLRVAVSKPVLAAAKRTLETGRFDRVHFQKAVNEACAAAKIPAFGTGQLRHSVATWAINAGANPASVAAFLGHKSPRTTRRFYATHATPAKVPTLL